MMANEGAIVSVTHQPRCRYDVFLSFRGKDTRYTFTGNLCNALQKKGFTVFMDDEVMKGGDQLSVTLPKAIEESRISIVVISKNYASSTWCLDELVNILDCMRTKNQLVWPVFYKVDPSDVRHQRRSYAKAMAKHEDRFGNDSDKVKKWRSALTEVADLKGWHSEKEYEYKFIDRIVQLATTKLHCEQLYVGEHIIGRRFCIEELKLLLDMECNDTVCMVGIHGIGGIGKTTLAIALYNLIADQFDCAICIESVRERSEGCMGLVNLQQAILFKLFGREDVKLGSVSEGVTILKDRLKHRRVLLLLDDVDNEDQLEKLAGESNWFGSGSRIIITTRDKHVLNVHKVEKTYEVKKLNADEALQLFCWSAFKTSQPAPNYEDVSTRAVCYADGLPLALKVIGSNLVGKSVEECECALEQYERILERKIQDILKVSYDCLPEKAQYIFLDIACFFKGKKRRYVEDILERCEFYPAFNIGKLVDKSLLTIDECNCLRMHDIIQEMGKEVVRQEAPRKPGERSRLYFHEDVLRVLEGDLGSSNIEGIILDPPGKVVVEWSGAAFEKMNNLRILIVRNAHFSSPPNYLPNSLRLFDWDGYPWGSFPPGFDPRNVVGLSLPCSRLRLEKENPLPKLEHLTYINFRLCMFLTHVPDMSGVPNLRELNLSCCTRLVSIHHSVGFLEKLEQLNADYCAKLTTFPPRIWLPSLQHISLVGAGLEFFPDIVGVMDKPLCLSLRGARIKELPHCISNLTGPVRLLAYGSSLRDLPSSFFMLPNIEELSFGGDVGGRETLRRRIDSFVTAMTSCSNLSKPHYSALQKLEFVHGGLTDEDLHFICSYFPNLKELELAGNNFVSIPASIKECAKLKFLGVRDCHKLEEIPELPLSVQQVNAGQCRSLSSETRMLWFQAFKEARGICIIMPQAQTRIPDWFDRRGEAGIVSFWARRKFPVVVFAFIFDEGMRHGQCDICVYINGRDALHFREKNRNAFTANVHGDDVLLCDLRCLPNGKEWPILDTFLLSEWNRVELVFDFYTAINLFRRKAKISYWGAYVYRQETNMEDIQFMFPNPLKRPPPVVHNPPKKRMRKLKPKNGGRKSNRGVKRRSNQFQTVSSRRRKKIVFPMSRFFWRFLSYKVGMCQQK